MQGDLWGYFNFKMFKAKMKSLEKNLPNRKVNKQQ